MREVTQTVAHVVGGVLQNHLDGGVVIGMDDHGAAEVHRALADGLLDHAEHIVPQFPALLDAQKPKLLGGERRGIVGAEGKGVNDHKGQSGRTDALQGQQTPIAAREREEKEAVLRLKAKEPVGKAEEITLLVLHRAEIFGVDLQRVSSSYAMTSTGS